MDQPLTIWYCDVCHQPIVDKNRALVIWKSDNTGYYDFKIVHQTINDQQGCDIPSYSGSMHLEEFLGIPGAVYLTSFLTTGPAHFGENNNIKNISEFVDLFRRLQVPYYEEARRYFSTEKTQSYIQGWNEFAPYLPETLKKIIEINS